MPKREDVISKRSEILSKSNEPLSISKIDIESRTVVKNWEYQKIHFTKEFALVVDELTS